MSKIVTRFAPSPTGYLHLGGLRTALYSYLWAKKHEGQFILRIEDTDQKRKVEGAEEQLISILGQLGLQHDQLFRQSDRLDLYREAAEKLIASGHAYRCYCSEERLEELRARQTAEHQVPRYDGRCRSLSAEEIQSHAGKPSVVRFRIPENRIVTVRDFIRGTITIKSEDLDDFVILKSDSWPTYHLAVVVDDSAMGVTHVIRGDEWLSSLPKHVLLYEAFGWQPPTFVHLPLLLNPDKSKLSKRQGDVAVEDYLAKGYLQAALINYVALLGWHPSSDEEFFTLEQLIKEFDLDRLQKSGAVFDVEKLNWYNSYYIRQAVEQNIPAYYQDVLAFVRAKVLPGVDETLLEKIIKVYSPRLEYLMLLKDRSQYIFDLPDYPAAMLVFKKSTKEVTTKGLRAVIKALTDINVTRWVAVEQLDSLLKEVVTTEGLSFGDVLWPVRVALSGVEQSPSPAELAWILGREESLRRLQLASDKLETMV